MEGGVDMIMPEDIMECGPVVDPIKIKMVLDELRGVRKVAIERCDQELLGKVTYAYKILQQLGIPK